MKVLYVTGNIIMIELIDTSKIYSGNKTTIIEEVAKLLNLKPGDKLAYLKTEAGTVIIKNMSDVEITE